MKFVILSLLVVLSVHSIVSEDPPADNPPAADPPAADPPAADPPADDPPADDPPAADPPADDPPAADPPADDPPAADPPAAETPADNTPADDPPAADPPADDPPADNTPAADPPAADPPAAETPAADNSTETDDEETKKEKLDMYLAKLSGGCKTKYTGCYAADSSDKKLRNKDPSGVAEDDMCEYMEHGKTCLTENKACNEDEMDKLLDLACGATRGATFSILLIGVLAFVSKILTQH